MSEETEEQKAFTDAFGDGKAKLGAALPGTGKTSCALKGASKTKKRVHLVVFNVKNETETQEKILKLGLTNMTAKTRHKTLLRMVGGRYKISKDKMHFIITRDDEYNPFIKDENGEKMPQNERLARSERYSAMRQLVGLTKNTFQNPTPKDVEFLLTHYGISSPDPTQIIVNDCLKFLRTSDNHNTYMDMDDMCRWPVIRGTVRADMDILINDECQDNNPIATDFVEMLKKLGVEIILVGDENQSILGFTGSDIHAIQNMKDRFNPVIYPLTINFRCDNAIIEEAKKLMPDLKAWDGAGDGIVGNKSFEEVMKEMQPGNVALSRYNKIIIPACFKMIRQGKKATIQGADIGKQLISMIEGFKAKDIDGFYEAIDLWKERQLKYKKSDGQIDIVEDKFEVLKFFADNSHTIEEMTNRIESIFSDESSDYKFSTAHKSKGLEWGRVYILDSNNFKITKGLPWQLEQENNLMKVAITRARNELYFVDDMSPPKK